MLLCLVGCGGESSARDAQTDASPDGGVLVDTMSDGFPDAISGDAWLGGGSSPPVDGGMSIAPEVDCTTNGCLRTARLVGEYVREDIEPFLETGVTIDNGYAVWSISYFTDGRESLATVTIPYRARPPSEGYAIVANNHGTTGLDDGCAFTGTAFGIGLAGLFGARGMIGVATDYPGIGTEGVHPYLVAEVNGHAALDALRAAGQLARWDGHALSGRMAMVGLSQGGHTTLAAAARHMAYAPELDIRAFGVTAPASGWESHWRAGMHFDGEHILYHALLVDAWSAHYEWEGPTPFTDTFDAGVLRVACTFDIRGNPVLAEVVGSSRDAVFTPAFQEAFRTGMWGTDYAAFADYFAANRVTAFTQTAPIRIYQGDADVTVPEASTREMVEALRGSGMRIEYEVVPDGTHIDVAFGFVATAERRTEESIAWVRGLLAGE